ncbi:unnamed protein product [Mucor hiemalis]
MLKQCQNKLSFSRLNWYSHALKAIIPKGEGSSVYSRLSRLQCRSASTMASVVDNDTSNFVIQRPPHPIPVQQLHMLNPDLRDTEKKEKSTAHIPAENYQRCSGFRKYDGQRCQRLVRTILPHRIQIKYFVSTITLRETRQKLTNVNLSNTSAATFQLTTQTYRQSK